MTGVRYTKAINDYHQHNDKLPLTQRFVSSSLYTPVLLLN